MSERVNEKGPKKNKNRKEENQYNRLESKKKGNQNYLNVIDKEGINTYFTVDLTDGSSK